MERSRGGRAVRQMQAIGCDRYLLRRRVEGRWKLQTRQITLRDFNFDSFSEEAEHGARFEIAPSWPDGVVVVECADRPAVARLEATGLDPCCVVRLEPGWQVWIRLLDLEEASRRERRQLEFELTLGARRLFAIAGSDPRAAHWQRSGAIIGLPEATGRIGELVGNGGGVAPAGPGVMEYAADMAQRLEEAKERAVEAGFDPAQELELLVADSQPRELSRAVYERQAAIARAFGAWDPDQVDASVVRAALKAGARPERIVGLLRAGSPGLRERHSDEAHYIARLIDEIAAASDVVNHLDRSYRRIAAGLAHAKTAAEAAEDRVASHFPGAGEVLIEED